MLAGGYRTGNCFHSGLFDRVAGGCKFGLMIFT